MNKQTRLYVACIIALVAMAFGFVVRGFVLTDWGVQFDLSETQKGSIQGAGPVSPGAEHYLFQPHH